MAQNSDILDTRDGDGLSRASFSLQHRVFRAAWKVTWLLLASWTPPPLHAWRAMILRAFGARIGAGARVYGSVDVFYPPNLTVGQNAVIGWKVNVYCQGPITLGDGAIVSQFAHLVTGTHDIDDRGFQLITRPITIGANAWVAANAFVGPGVTIGEGAVLGACGVAFRDLPPWTVHAGNPARFIRNRKAHGQDDGAHS
jgi:putative colanic acid biosynthesis acetyltransferase WcaF